MDESDVRDALADVEAPAVLSDADAGEVFRAVTGRVADMVGLVRRRDHSRRTGAGAEAEHRGRGLGRSPSG